VHPPADPNAPTFADLSSSVGAQYMWVDRLFIFNSNKPEGRKNFMYQLVKTYRPGSMDTSLISTDSINNPRTMNAVYDFPSRMGSRKISAREARGRGIRHKQFNEYCEHRSADRVLLQVGPVRAHAACAQGRRGLSGFARGAESRLLEYRIFSEEWLLHFKPGGRGSASAARPSRVTGAA